MNWLLSVLNALFCPYSPSPAFHSLVSALGSQVLGICFPILDNIKKIPDEK